MNTVGVVISRGPRSNEAVLDLAVRNVLHYWPEAVVVNVDGEVVEAHDQIHLQHLLELFVYKNQASLDSWRAEGATDENNPTMVHIIVDYLVFTVVTDAAADHIIRRIRAAFGDP